MVRAPRSALVTPGWAMVNAIARWVMGSPASAASGTSRSTTSRRRSSVRWWTMPARRRSLCWSLRTRPVSRPWPSGPQTRVPTRWRRARDRRLRRCSYHRVSGHRTIRPDHRRCVRSQRARAHLGHLAAGSPAAYDAVNCGRIDIARLRRSLAGLPLPAWPGGRIRLGVDVSPWLRPDAAASPGRLFCHVYGRGTGQAQMIPGWPYSVVAALEPGRTSWTAVLDAIRPGPADDETEVTATQVRDVVGRLITAGHWQPGDPDILIVFDAGYDVSRLARQLTGLPVELMGRLRPDRVLYFPAPPGTGGRGRPARHGPEFALADPATWPGAQITTSTATSRYGTAVAAAWDRLHPRLTHRGAWLGHDGKLPIIEGTQIRLARPLAGDLRRPCERPCAPGRLTPGPGPPRISEPPREDPLPGQCTETRQTRPRTSARVTEPPSRTQLRGRETFKRERTLKAVREREG